MRYIFLLTASLIFIGSVTFGSIPYNRQNRKVITVSRHSAGHLPIIYNTPKLKNHHTGKYKFPFSWGASMEGVVFRQHYETEQLFLRNDKITAYSDSLTQVINAGEYQLLFRPQIWVLPFVNVYGILGYVQGDVTPNIIAHGITIKLPVLDSIYEVNIDTSMTVNEPMKYNGPVYGFGITVSYIYKNFMISLDYNYSEVHPKEMDGKLISHRISPKLGYVLTSKNKKNEEVLWLGASWLNNTQTLTGVISVREFAGDLADYLGEEADYVATLTPVDKWNMVAGGSWSYNKHFNLAIEVGFIGRRKVSLGFLYLF